MVPTGVRFRFPAVFYVFSVSITAAQPLYSPSRDEIHVLLIGKSSSKGTHEATADETQPPGNAPAAN
jgi:hypothetical protein